MEVMTKEDLNYKIKHHLLLIQKNILGSVSLKSIDEDKLHTPDKNLKLKTRDLLFELEGLLRLHIKTQSLSKKQLKTANKILAFLKKAEDFLGRLDLSNTLQKESKSFNLVSKKELKNIKESLINDWTDISRIEKNFLELDFKYQPKSILKLLSRELKRIDVKSRSLKKYIDQEAYSHENLELGFHEWRRSIRWISIYIQFYKNYFYLVESSNKTPYPILKEFEDSIFTQFPKKAPISMNKRIFYELSAYIYYSGKLKEKLEVKTLLKKESFIHYEYSCQKMYKKFHKEKLLKNFNKYLKISK